MIIVQKGNIDVDDEAFGVSEQLKGLYWQKFGHLLIIQNNSEIIINP